MPSKSEEESINQLDNDTIMDFVNGFLPDSQKIPKEKSEKIIPEAKKIFLNLKKEPKSSRVDFGAEFFEIAKTDFRRSTDAYNLKDYPNAIYHLQQSIEKLVKAFGLCQGSFSEKELRTISHKTPLAFIELIKEEKIGLFITSLKKIHPNLNTNTDDLKLAINTKGVELALSSEDAIRSQLDLVKQIEDALMNSRVDQVLEQALPALAKLQGNDRKYPNFSVMKFSSIFIKMYILAAITYPHEAFTRYPDREVKPSQYNETLGIVKTAPQIFEIIKDAIDIFDKFLKWENENKVQTN